MGAEVSLSSVDTKLHLQAQISDQPCRYAFTAFYKSHEIRT